MAIFGERVDSLIVLNSSLAVGLPRIADVGFIEGLGKAHFTDSAFAVGCIRQCTLQRYEYVAELAPYKLAVLLYNGWQFKILYPDLH